MNHVRDELQLASLLHGCAERKCFLDIEGNNRELVGAVGVIEGGLGSGCRGQMCGQLWGSCNGRDAVCGDVARLDSCFVTENENSKLLHCNDVSSLSEQRHDALLMPTKPQIMTDHLCELLVARKAVTLGTRRACYSPHTDQR
ncbi:hypothetical protein Tco_1218183 [Tanacetum coccineum]